MTDDEEAEASYIPPKATRRLSVRIRNLEGLAMADERVVAEWNAAREIDQLTAEIERLRAENARLSSNRRKMTILSASVGTSTSVAAAKEQPND